MDEIIGQILGVIAIQTGRALVWLVTAGRWRGEPLFGNEGRIYSAAGALTFLRDGKRVITKTGLSLIGGAFYLAFLVTAIAVAVVV